MVSVNMKLTDMWRIQNENIIMLVRNRPVLWDKTLKSFRDNELKRQIWGEVSKSLYENFEEMDEFGQKDFVNAVMKRWARLKRRFLKSRKELDNSESVSNQDYKFIYSDSMQFLEKVYLLEPKSLSIGDTRSDHLSNDKFFLPAVKIESSTGKTGTTKQLRLNKVKSEEFKSQESDFSSSLNIFFQSIIPHLNRLSCREFLEFQEGFLMVVAKILKKKTQCHALDFNP